MDYSHIHKYLQQILSFRNNVNDVTFIGEAIAILQPKTGKFSWTFELQPESAPEVSTV